MFEENSYRRNTISRLRSNCFPICLPFLYQIWFLVFCQCFLGNACQGSLGSTLDTLLSKGGQKGLLSRTYLCKGPGVGSNPGKLQTGQEAVELEPGLAQENGCLSGPHRLHDGPQPERGRGTIAVSLWRLFPGAARTSRRKTGLWKARLPNAFH